LIKPPCSVKQISLADDAVTLENRLCLVTRHLHRDPFRDASANQIPDSGSSEVVREFTG
jgi:hypothetical protein